MISRVPKQPLLKIVILSVRLLYVALLVEHLATNDGVKGPKAAPFEISNFIS
jgi:hypothetical protein